MKQVLLKIASVFYGIGISLRHRLFDWGVLRGAEFDTPIICVGNITVGGTGKTPAVEMLVAYFSAEYNVAVLSRGYGRTTKGYLEVSTDDSYLDVGDEPLQIKRKFPQVKVVVCEKRAYAIERIERESPEINMIIMDDGFQHRYVKPFINIIMVDATRPVQQDHLLPYGQLRDTVGSLRRAHYFLVTKCPDDMTPIDARIMRKVLAQAPYQYLYFTRTSAGKVYPVFADEGGSVAEGAEVIAMAGIGNNDVFFEGLRRRYKVVDIMEFEDHHRYRLCDLSRMRTLLAQHPQAVIVTTEKDAVKLSHSTKISGDVRARLFYESVDMEFMYNLGDEFFGRLEKDLKQYKKSKNDGTYIRGC